MNDFTDPRPRPISIKPDDFIVMLRTVQCSITLRPDIQGIEFSRFVNNEKRTYITVGNYQELVDRMNLEIADILFAGKGLAMTATRLTAQDFIDKIKTSTNWSVVESAEREEIELLVFTGDSDSPVERYFGPDPQTTNEDDLMSFMEYLLELVEAYNVAAAAEAGDIQEEDDGKADS